MPEPTKPGDGQPGAGAGAPEGGEPPKSGEAPKLLSLTQEQFDSIIQERVRRAVPADYEELKGLKTAKDLADATALSELEKAKAAAKRSEEKGNAAVASANATLKQASIISEATTAGAVDVSIVVALLAGNEDITIKDGVVTGAKEAVAKLLKEKPFLSKAPPPPKSGAEFGGNDPATKTQKISDLDKRGVDMSLTQRQRQEALEESRRLKQG